MTRSVLLAATALAAIGTSAVAQEHSGHGGHEAAAPDDCETEAEMHRAMGHPVSADRCEPPTKQRGAAKATVGEADAHDELVHGATDHGAMNHGDAPSSLAELPPPAAAGSGPPHAADAIWGAKAMRESRAALRREHGDLAGAGIVADRLEYRARDGRDGLLWDVDAWYGGDLERIWIESEGEAALGGGLDQADVSVLYGRAISPWFDLQAGVRQDLAGPERTYLDLGLQGVAPYFLEIEADMYLSTRGDLTATAEIELDQRITQRLILQPRAEIALAAQDVPELGIGAGIDRIEAGVRLRYEVAREFAPYVGIEQEWKLGGSADYARASGEATRATSYVAGLRFWF